MNALLKSVATVALLSATVLPAAAAVDVPALTCADFTAMDGVARLQAATEVLAYIHAENSVNVSPDLIAKYDILNSSEDGWTGEKLKIEIEGHCIDADPAMGVLARLDEHT